MTGTIVNAAAIVAGGTVGLFAKQAIRPRIEEAVHQACGLAVIVIGLNGIISNMFTVREGGVIGSSGELLLVFSLVLGVIAGELLDIDTRLNGLGAFVEERFHLTGFAASFVNGTLIYCVGAMAIVGSISDGLRGDPSVLFTKSVLDGITSIVLAATMGPGVIFSALPVFLYQGALTLLAGLLEPVLQGELLRQICAVGYTLVACIGVNFMSERFRIKVANYLPALLVPAVWAAVRSLLA